MIDLVSYAVKFLSFGFQANLKNFLKNILDLESQNVRKFCHNSGFTVILENDPFLAVRKRLDIFERQPYQHQYTDLYLAVDAHARGQERVTS